ncbi:MAG: hypothetical protein U1F43_00135 [Myxococcota bacterium]
MRTLQLIDLLAVTLCTTAAGCVARGPYDPSDGKAVGVVREVEAAIARGDLAGAHAAVDYRARLDEVLGDLWRSGSPEDQADMVAFSQVMFEETTRRYWGECCARALMAARVSRLDGDSVWVESSPADSTTGFVWMYRLSRRGDTWRITQREYRDGRALRSDSTRFWPMAIRKIASQYGRMPTLRELTANLPTAMKTIRAKVYTVGELPGRPSP